MDNDKNLDQMLSDYMERNDIPDEHREYIEEIVKATKLKTRYDVMEEIKQRIVNSNLDHYLYMVTGGNPEYIM